MRHRFTEEQVRAIVSALDSADVPVIEVSHGDGAGGSTSNYGFSLADEFALISAAAEEAAQARIAVLLLPGLGTGRDLQRAHDCGEAGVGFPGHQNLSLGVANSVLAVQNSVHTDGALCALGAGAGAATRPPRWSQPHSTGWESVLASTCKQVMAAAEYVVKPLLSRLPWGTDGAAITQGYVCVYSAFLLHAEQAGRRHGVPAHQILQRAGELGYVGGQEDMITGVALDLLAAGKRV
jgi:hypothetical protein